MILGEMEEAAKGEIFIQEIDEKTLGSMITFVYTGEFEIDEDVDVQMMAYTADKYDLPGFTKNLIYKLSKEETLKPKVVADTLIAAHRHDNEQLRAVAVVKIRNEINIVNEEQFREQFRMGINLNDFIFDLFNDL